MYLIFAGEQFYGTGGANDFIDSFEIIEEAMEKAEALIGSRIIYEISDWSDDASDDQGIYIDWSHVFCTKDKRIIKRIGVKPFGEQPIIEVRI